MVLIPNFLITGLLSKLVPKVVETEATALPVLEVADLRQPEQPNLAAAMEPMDLMAAAVVGDFMVAPAGPRRDRPGLEIPPQLEQVDRVQETWQLGVRLVLVRVQMAQRTLEIFLAVFQEIIMAAAVAARVTQMPAAVLDLAVQAPKVSSSLRIYLPGKHHHQEATRLPATHGVATSD